MGDESHYALALEEFESGTTDKGLAAKAFVKADGVAEKVKVEYIKLRVSQLKSTPDSNFTLQTWYAALDHNQRVALFVASILLIALYGIGLIPLMVALYLEAGERDKLAGTGKYKDSSKH